MEQASRAERVRAEQANVLGRHLPVVIGTSLLTSTIVALALRGRVPDFPLAPWFAAAVLLAAVRTLYLLRWRAESSGRAETLRRRVRQMTVLSGLSGTLWGVFGIFTVSASDPVTSLVVVMVLTGLVASATASLSHFPSVYLAFVLPALLPVALSFLAFEETLYVWVCVLICLYLVVSITFSQGIRAALRRSVELGVENVELVEELRAKNERIEQALGEAERANLAKSRFLAAASHDLRQPLHSLRLFAATLKSQVSVPKHRATVLRMEAAVRALEGSFTALLDISRLDAGTWRVEREHVRLGELLECIGREFGAFAREKNLALSISHDDEVVHTDPLMLERLLGNLVGNALRYTEEGAVSITTRVQGSSVHVTVGDSGPGIASEDRERVFEEFVQLRSPGRDRSEGVGLGLSIVRRIARLLELPLTLESTKGQGTSLTLELPLGERSRAATSVVPASIPAPDFHGVFVLVIDDEEGVRAATVGLLEEWGCMVLCADSAEQALERLEEYEYPPDLVIADLESRRGGTGAEALITLRARYGADVTGIIVTGDIAPDHLRIAETSGFPVLHKPCDPDALRARIERLRNR